MNWKTWVPLIVAIVFALAAAKAAHNWMLKNRAVATPAGKFVKVVVTKTDIQPGSALKAEDLTLAQIEADKAPANSFNTVDQVAGRVSEALMVKNQPVVEAMLAPTGSGSGLQALVPPGERAVTIEVNEFSGVAGLLQPGCHVDIIATINEGNNGGQLAKTIVQNVKVTAVGQRTTATPSDVPQQNPGEMSKSVTVLATLADAEAIELACSTGRPRLVLRSGRDNEVASTSGITLGELRGGGHAGDPFVAVAPPAPATQPAVAVAPTTQPTEAVAHREPAHRTVRMIKGGVESTVTLNVLEHPSEDATANTSTDPFEGN
jgi:pilus assembly protein CpaB